MKLPKYCEFTQPEIDKLIGLCNFTDEQLEFFLLRTKDKTNVQIAIQMNVSESKVSYIAKKVKRKIIAVLDYC